MLYPREPSLKTRAGSHDVPRKPPVRSVSDQPREASAKSILASQVNQLIDSRELSQSAVALMVGMTQPKVSQIRRYQLQNISLERLMYVLIALGQHVEIVVRPAREREASTITVAA